MEIEFKYKDKYITISGADYYRKKDENCEEISGKVLERDVEDFFDEKFLNEMLEITTKYGCDYKRYYKISSGDKEYNIPLNCPKNLNKKIKDEIREYGKSVYFNLMCLGDDVEQNN